MYNNNQQYQQGGPYQQNPYPQQQQQGYQYQQGGYPQQQGGYPQQNPYPQYQQQQPMYNQQQNYNQNNNYPMHQNIRMQQPSTNSQASRQKNPSRNYQQNGNNNNNNNQKQGNSWYDKLVSTDYSGTIFSDEVVRKGFVRKVLTIIGCQFFLTTIFCIGAVFSESYQDFLKRNYWLYTLCWVVTLGTMITLYCFRQQARKYPRNYILLFVFTLAESVMISFACAFAPPGTVLLASGITCALVFGLTIYAVKTDRDITQKANAIMYAGFAVLALCIVGIFFRSALLSLIISLALILLFSVYLVFDIQRLQGRKELAYDIDDYIIAALDIYIDIVVLFRQILFILGIYR